MKKPWSITTTLRNPERLRNFLMALRELNDRVWNSACQQAFQILLIQKRLYGFGSRQFYADLSAGDAALIDAPSRPISYAKAEQIFQAKRYEDPAMRGRQSLNPLKKIGLAGIVDGKVIITELGDLLLRDDYDLGDIFFRSFIKWQLPNPLSHDYPDDGEYGIKPFVGTLHLIQAVNERARQRGDKAKGISKDEFSLFVPTLTHHRDIEKHADAIIALRGELSGKTADAQKRIWDNTRQKFAAVFLGAPDKARIAKLLNNLRDYGDNAIRYFRLTRYVIIRGNGYYVDLEPRRQIEIDALLAHDNGGALSFQSAEEYSDYIADIALPQLPWETREHYMAILANVRRELAEIGAAPNAEQRRLIEQKTDRMSATELKEHIALLRACRKDMLEQTMHARLQDAEAIQECIGIFENIYQHENRPVLLEKIAARGLHALNDALKIQPNYPVGDDNEPTFTAPANVPDIECYYQTFNAICEVTMLKGCDQWYHEGQPVMRHLRDFEDMHAGKTAYCLFIAPALHRDTLNTFWSAIKHDYEGRAQRIVPMSIAHFVLVLQTLLAAKRKRKFFSQGDIQNLYDAILATAQEHQVATQWAGGIAAVIADWRRYLLAA